MTGWKSLVMGVIVSVLTAVVLLGVCAVLISGGVIPEVAGEGGVLLACALGCFAGGRVAVGAGSGAPLLWGVASGGVTAVVLGVSGFLLYGDLESARCAAVGGACLCGGGLSGVLGGKKRRR